MGNRVIASLLVLAAIPLETSADLGPHVAWGRHAMWDDGLAEVAVYQSQRVVYGKLRTFETTLITVKEDFNAAYHAKAEPPYKGKSLLAILKLNVVAEIHTEHYPYRYLTSVFVDRNDVGRVIKMTVGSQEWCGNTFKEVRAWGGKHELAYHSYWDGEGDGVYAMDWTADTMLEDQLALSLRALPFAKGHKRQADIIPTQVSNRAVRPVAEPGRIHVVGRERIESGGESSDAWRVEVSFGETRQTYWFQETHPNIMLRFESSDGRHHQLDHWSRRTYW